MTNVTKPADNSVVFANQSDFKNEIPESNGLVGQVTMDVGFPEETMKPLNQGGQAPSGWDFNGILNYLSSHQVWLNSGGMYSYSLDYTTKIGGYPVGAVVQSSDKKSSYVNTVVSNITNPNTGGAGWLPFAGEKLTEAYALLSQLAELSTELNRRINSSGIRLSSATASNIDGIFFDDTANTYMLNRDATPATFSDGVGNATLSLAAGTQPTHAVVKAQLDAYQAAMNLLITSLQSALAANAAADVDNTQLTSAINTLTTLMQSQVVRHDISQDLDVDDQVRACENIGALRDVAVNVDDVSGLRTELNNIKTGAHVTRGSLITPNLYTGTQHLTVNYRLHRDGYLEQWGTAGGSTTAEKFEVAGGRSIQINLPIAYDNSSYEMQAQIHSVGNEGSDGNYVPWITHNTYTDVNGVNVTPPTSNRFFIAVDGAGSSTYTFYFYVSFRTSGYVKINSFTYTAAALTELDNSTGSRAAIDISIPANSVLVGLKSTYFNVAGKYDRSWQAVYQTVSESSSALDLTFGAEVTTGYVNAEQAYFDYIAPDNCVITGIYSAAADYNVTKTDRKFKFKYRQVSNSNPAGLVVFDDEVSIGYVHEYHDLIDFVVPTGCAIYRIFSKYSTTYKDRIFGVAYKKLSYI